LLDDGRLTDGQGQTVNFRNTVIIMTSNLGSQYFTQVEDPAALHERIMDTLKGHFRPEFLNRIDEIVLFHQLSKEHIIDIVDIQIQLLAERIKSLGYELKVSDDTKTFLAEKGYDTVYGARPLKRLIQRLVENPLSIAVLEGKYNAGDTINVNIGENKQIVLV